MSEHALKEDVGFLKRLASQGRGEPAPLAWLLALFGLIYGTMVLVPFGMYRWDIIDLKALQHFFPAFAIGGNAIFALGLLAALVQMWMTRKSRPRVNAVALATWIGALIALVTACYSFIRIVFFVARVYKAPAVVMVMTIAIPVVALVLYGMAWWAAAAVTGRKSLFLVAIGSFAAAIVIGTFPQSVEVVASIALLLLAFVPGLILALSARRKAAS